MTSTQAHKIESEILIVCLKHPEVWVTVSKEMRPDLRMVKIEISIKVEDDVRYSHRNEIS